MKKMAQRKFLTVVIRTEELADFLIKYGVVLDIYSQPIAMPDDLSIDRVECCEERKIIFLSLESDQLDERFRYRGYRHSCEVKFPEKP